MARSSLQELEGTSELAAALRKRAKFISGPAIRKALRVGGRILRDAEREAAPVLDRKTAESTSLEPGALRDGVRMYSRDTSEGEPEVIVGPSSKVAHVAGWVEFGHRNVKGGSSTVTATGTRGAGKASETDTPAHPWLRPAYESSIGEVSGAIVASMKESLAEGGNGNG